MYADWMKIISLEITEEEIKEYENIKWKKKLGDILCKIRK